MSRVTADQKVIKPRPLQQWTNKPTTMKAEATESNLEKVPKNKFRSFRTLPIHEKKILGSSIFARINPNEEPEDIEKHAYSGFTSAQKLAITSMGERIEKNLHYKMEQTASSNTKLKLLKKCLNTIKTW